MNSYIFTVELTNPISNVQVPIEMLNVDRLKILQMRYYTGSVGNKAMLVQIKDFQDNKIYFNGSQYINYTSMYLLSKDIDVPILFDNYNNQYDCVKQLPIKSLSKFDVVVYINNQIANDITSLNPLILTLQFEGPKTFVEYSLDDKK